MNANTDYLPIMNQQEEKIIDRQFPWDTPSKEVPEIARQFTYGLFETNNLNIHYRLFIPKTNEKAPLVIYLHGAGNNGDDNEKQLEHDVAVTFALNKWQKDHPCYILAPQCPEGAAWEMSTIQPLLEPLFNEVLQKHPLIDRTRIYLYGCSMGSVGGIFFIKDHPSFLAGALLICGATTKENLIKLFKTPLWLFHAKDDCMVSTTLMQHPIFKGDFIGSATIYEELLKLGKKDIYYTEYPSGLLHEKYSLKSHCAWVPTFEDDKAKTWLFSLHH